MNKLGKKILLFVSSLAVAALLLTGVPASAQNRTPRYTRPANEPWSDGPTLLLKHKVNQSAQKAPHKAYVRTRARLRAMNWGKNKATINVHEDMFNYLNGANGQQGKVSELKDKTRTSKNKDTGSRHFGKLIKAAHSSRDRVKKLLNDGGIKGEQRNLLAEMMVWRGLAYNSSTLAHGSFGPKDVGNGELQQKAFNGLNAAIAESFKLGNKLQASVKTGDKSFLRWKDITHIQGRAIKDFPEKEPGQVRTVNFTWPVNSFGADKAALQGPNGHVERFNKFLTPGKNGKGFNRSKAFSRNPIRYMSTTLHWLHNIHPFRDGNGRTEVLLGWSMAKAAGYDLPLDYDQAAGRFKLAATKWGGTIGDHQRFLAKGALGAERFVRKLLPHIKGKTIVSNHTDHGAVGMVTKNNAGKKSLMVMLPVTHAAKMDPELKAEQGKNRVVHVGKRFSPSDVTIQIAVDGKHNEWKTVKPTAVNKWNNRYPWWTTVEPIYNVSIPQGASFVNFRIVGPDGKQIGPEDYYMNLKEYKNINSRIGS